MFAKLKQSLKQDWLNLKMSVDVSANKFCSIICFGKDHYSLVYYFK